MKTIIVLLILSSITAAQNFFPTELNNSYQVHSTGYGYAHGGSSWSHDDWYSLTIFKDSVIEGKRFVQFKGAYIFPATSLFHYDQSDQKVYVKLDGNDTIKLAIDFNAAPGDSFMAYIDGPEPHKYFSRGITYINKFGQLRQSYTMDYDSYPIMMPYMTSEFCFVEDIGIIRKDTHFSIPISMYSYSYANVEAAIVNSIVYGNISLNIDSIFPLSNRPVNEFWFYLNGTFTSTTNLIDTFYVNVIHIRGEDTLDTFSYPFINNKAFISLQPEEGDKLLLKAFISDNSIFHNTDVYPDSGYAEILVLPSTVNVDDNFKVYSFSLEQNYPNPFNPSTTIQYIIPERSFVSLIIYDAMGNEISRPVNEEKSPGIYTSRFNGSSLASGVYFYKLTAGTRSEIKKMLLLK